MYEFVRMDIIDSLMLESDVENLPFTAGMGPSCLLEYYIAIENNFLKICMAPLVLEIPQFGPVRLFWILANNPEISCHMLANGPEIYSDSLENGPEIMIVAKQLLRSQAK